MDDDSRGRKRVRVNSVAQRLDALKSWVQSRLPPRLATATNETVCFGTGDDERAVKAVKELRAGDEFMWLPKELIISSDVARRSPVGQALAALDVERGPQAKRFPPQMYLVFFLVSQKAQGDAAAWAPYVQALPSEFNDVLWFSDEVAELLIGTNLYSARRLQLERLQQMFDSVFPAMWERPEAALFPRTKFTLDDLKWAWSAYISRGFRVQLFFPDADKDDCGCMLPFLDMLNHRHGSAITWVTHDDTVAFRSEAAVHAGQELFNNYGPKSNEECLHRYGFCVKDHPGDMAVVKLALDAEMVVGRRKILLDHMSKLSGQRWEDQFLVDHTLSPMLLGTLRICVANDEELQTLYRRQSDAIETVLSEKGYDDLTAIYVNATSAEATSAGIRATADWLSFVSHRNDVAMAENLQRLLLRRLGTLQAHDIDDAAAQQRPHDAQRIANILVYRDSQKHLLTSSCKLADALLAKTLRNAYEATPLPPPTAPQWLEPKPDFLQAAVVLRNGIPVLSEAVTSGAVVALFDASDVLAADDDDDPVVRIVSELADGLEPEHVAMFMVLSKLCSNHPPEWLRNVGSLLAQYDDADPDGNGGSRDEIIERVQDLRELFDALFPAVCDVAPAIFPRQHCTWTNFLKAAGVVQGWGHDVHELNGDTSFAVMPTVPRFRHHPFAPFGWRRIHSESGSGVALVALTDLPAESELVLSYGSERLSTAAAAEKFGSEIL